MMEERYGAPGRLASHFILWAVLAAIGMSAVGVIGFWVDYLSGIFVGQGFLFSLFIFISFSIIGVVGGVVYFILEKALGWYRNRKVKAHGKVHTDD